MGPYSYGQIEDIRVDGNTNVDYLYAGLYPRWQSSVDTLNFQDKVSFRVGARVTHTFSKVFSINAQAALQFENGEDVLPIIDYAFLTNISEDLQLRLGSFATPNTLLRPNPITWQGHSETYAQSRIEPGRPGALMAYSLNDTQSINVGYHYQNEVWASHTMVDFGNIAVAGWVQNDGEYFGLIDYENDKVEVTLNYGSINREWASSIFYNISNRYTIFTDINYRTDLEKSDIFRLGGRSYFHSEALHIKGFLALQYDFAARFASAEFFIHLN